MAMSTKKLACILVLVLVYAMSESDAISWGPDATWTGTRSVSADRNDIAVSGNLPLFL